MKIHISTIVGITLFLLIIIYLSVWGSEKRKNKEKMTAAEGISIAVFTFWAFAILLDVMFVHEYTFTVVKGIELAFGESIVQNEQLVPKNGETTKL